MYSFILGFQGFMIVERASLYGSRNVLDQHREMRMDIDNMSYEVAINLLFFVTISIIYILIILMIGFFRNYLHLGRGLAK
jgi:hypothetical protein